MAALERLPHHLHIADAFEREVRAAIGDVDHGLHDLVLAMSMVSMVSGSLAFQATAARVFMRAPKILGRS